jgi:hypothetical protein
MGYQQPVIATKSRKRKAEIACDGMAPRVIAGVSSQLLGAKAMLLSTKVFQIANDSG